MGYEVMNKKNSNFGLGSTNVICSSSLDENNVEKRRNTKCPERNGACAACMWVMSNKLRG